MQAIGRIHELPESAQQALQKVIDQTSVHTGLTLILALNYSGRAEMEDAIRSICYDVASGKLTPEAFSQADIQNRLYTKNCPDPDLLIRTSGEMRLSNFLLWQLSYTEIYVTPKRWPDFDAQDLQDAISDFQRRQRRFGGI